MRRNLTKIGKFLECQITNYDTALIKGLEDIDSIVTSSKVKNRCN